MQICICRIRVEYRTIEEWCEILDSQRIPITAKNRIEGPYPYYGANGIQDYVNDYIFDDELVLLAEDGGNFGSKDRPIAYRVSGKCWVNNHAHVLKPKKGLDVDYLCYSLMFYNTNGLVNGATRQKLTQSTMRTMKIPCLEINEQQEIVQKIKKIESILNDLNGQLELLDELIKARFVEMFGDSITNDKNLKLISLFDLSVLKAGKSIKTGELSETYDDETLMYPCFGGNGIRGYINRYSHDGNYPVIGRQGAWAGNVNYATGKFYATEHAIVVTPKVDLNTVWYYYGLKYLDLTRFQTGAAQPGLAVDKLNKVFIPFPAIELQNQFASFVEEIDKSRLFSNHLLFLIKSISSNH